MKNKNGREVHWLFAGIASGIMAGYLLFSNIAGENTTFYGVKFAIFSIVSMLFMIGEGQYKETK